MKVFSNYANVPRGLCCGGVEDAALPPTQAKNPASKILFYGVWLLNRVE
ncbi:hypothetical protein RUMHYD_00796 [Blautia hydrogenotrophica DSM 10507]|uniref:Uncharacterized protein n=1 Tax=Blautia hydrogenotrophica (strain DSM 10507 / JCM 14656 / S5a33) TaxID=476272 RepID=C0CIX9_BLAHS|nr:hypothetical protein RUMHYD_00796 [Blautia hydrogenotrophica DSM 10507]